MKVRYDLAFTSHAPAGSVFYRVADTYEMNICDCCGNKRKCDLYEHSYETKYGTADVVFMDLCRTCAKEHTTEVKE